MARIVALLLAWTLLAAWPAVGGASDASADPLASALEDLRGLRGGTLPDLLWVDGGDGPQPVPFGQARLHAGARLVGGSAPSDAGYGVRTGPNPCYVAAVVTAVGITEGDEDLLLFDPPTSALPDADVPCGAPLSTWFGSGGAGVADGWAADACVAFDGSFGAWVTIPESCHFGGFARATLHGRVGYLDARYCEDTWCFVLQQVFAGTVNGPGQTDAAALSIE